MKTVVIKDYKVADDLNTYTFDLASTPIKGCCGCWSCWLATPGRCIAKELDTFYHEYITADRAVYFAKVRQGFVSGELKTLFDRMLPLYMPYITFKTGESMHVKRYEKYPNIEFYYEGNFETEESRAVFEDYIHRVFYQFHSDHIVIKPIEAYTREGEMTR